MAPSRPPSAPSPWIVRFAPRIPEATTVLDLACGAGRHARFFLARGHRVTAVDIDVNGLADLEGTSGLEIVCADLEGGSPWPLPGRRFGAVVVTNYLWRPLFPAILDAVAPHGLLLYETFAVGNEALGKPRQPEFLLRPDELIDVVKGRLRIAAYEHGRLEHPRPAIKQRICAAKRADPIALPQPD